MLIQGSASRSGEDDHNKVLSGARAASVLERLIPKGIRGAQIVDAIGLGSPKLGPVEDEGDRAVFLLLSLPLNVEVVSIHTDDWNRELVWDDIVELGGTDRKSIQKINIQLRAWGAPRVWNVDGRDRQVMPDPFPLEAQVQRDGRTIPQNRWSLRMAGADAQPADRIQTLYRRSDSAVAWGFVSHDPRPGVATIARATVEISLGLDDGWADRGSAVQGGAKAAGRLDAKRLLEAGGVEILTLAEKTNSWTLKWLLRSPADLFFYSGNSTKAGCLSWVGDCWAAPDVVAGQWRGLSDMKFLIIGAPHVLQMNVVNGFAMGAPGAKWGSLLKTKGGPLTAIMGYRDLAPAIKDVGKQIAEQMGKKIASGIKDDEWVETWLSINAEHPGKDTWNAVGIDQSGYSWIEKRSAWSRSFDLVPGISGDKYEIKGPAPIA